MQMSIGTQMETTAKRFERQADWCVVGHGYQAINPTPIEALVQ